MLTQMWHQQTQTTFEIDEIINHESRSRYDNEPELYCLTNFNWFRLTEKKGKYKRFTQTMQLLTHKAYLRLIKHFKNKYVSWLLSFVLTKRFFFPEKVKVPMKQI